MIEILLVIRCSVSAVLRRNIKIGFYPFFFPFRSFQVIQQTFFIGEIGSPELEFRFAIAVIEDQVQGSFLPGSYFVRDIVIHTFPLPPVVVRCEYCVDLHVFQEVVTASRTFGNADDSEVVSLHTVSADLGNVLVPLTLRPGFGTQLVLTRNRELVSVKPTLDLTLG